MDINFNYLSLQETEIPMSDNITSALNDYKWIVKILNSSETKDHLECTEKCFNLWDIKYLSSDINGIEHKFLKRLRNYFWSNFHRKRISIIFKKNFVPTVKN